ncbi:MAG: hypothetical protein NT164_05365 [Verrucomicrobiae bacterium]|nr:hypothetical protein [Verrucomicrobiae bacterium]
MEISPLKSTLAVALILLTFCSEKVFSMDCFRRNKTVFPAEEKQARSQEGRAEDKRGDQSAVISRGVLEPGQGPAEQQEEAQSNGKGEGSFDEVPAVAQEQDGRQSFYPYGYDRRVSSREEVDLCLKSVQKIYNETRLAFIEAGRLDDNSSIHSRALDLAQRQIASLAEEWKKATDGDKDSLNKIKADSAALYSSLSAMKEDAAAVHQLNQIRMYNALTGKSHFTSVQKKVDRATFENMREDF